MEKAACLFVWQALLLDDVVKQLAALHELHNEEQLALGLNDFVQLHNIGVSDNLQNLNFTHDPGDVCLLFDFVFFKYFDGHLLLGQDMGPDAHLTERALPDGLANHVVADSLVRLLLTGQPLHILHLIKLINVRIPPALSGHQCPMHPSHLQVLLSQSAKHLIAIPTDQNPPRVTYQKALQSIASTPIPKQFVPNTWKLKVVIWVALFQLQ